MRAMTWVVFAAALASIGEPTHRRANFVHVKVTSSGAPVTIRGVWPPHAGAISTTGFELEWAWGKVARFADNPDSARRWNDPSSRDTVTTKTPTEFIVEMMRGPIVVESAGRDSIHVETQQTVRRGPVVAAWGHSFVISADGISPHIIKRS